MCWREEWARPSRKGGSVFEDSCAYAKQSWVCKVQLIDVEDGTWLNALLAVADHLDVAGLRATDCLLARLAKLLALIRLDGQATTRLVQVFCIRNLTLNDLGLGHIVWCVLLVLALLRLGGPGDAAAGYGVGYGCLHDLIPGVLGPAVQCGRLSSLILKEGIRDARRQVLGLLEVRDQKLVIMIAVSLVELLFCVHAGSNVSLDLAADELSRLAEDQVTVASMRILGTSTVTALLLLAARWLENLEHAVITLCALELLLDVHLLGG